MKILFIYKKVSIKINPNPAPKSKGAFTPCHNNHVDLIYSTAIFDFQ